MTIQTAVQFMMEQGYMVQIKGKYKVTAKFNKEITGSETGLIMLSGTPVVMEQEPPAIGQSTDWRNLYTQFIREAEVPARGESRDGSYDLNKYSEPAMKAFKKIIEKDRVSYPLLVKSTLLYYKTHRRYAHSISRYITEGFWRSDYEALCSSAAEGKVEDHIKQEIANDTEFSRFKIG